MFGYKTCIVNFKIGDSNEINKLATNQNCKKL